MTKPLSGTVLDMRPKGIRESFQVRQRPLWLQKPFWKDTWSDVKKVPWAWLGRRFLSHVLPLLAMSGLSYLLVLMSLDPGLFTTITNDFCKPDGTFLISPYDYTPWKRDGFFVINLSFGRYTFSQAKLIDICWDWAVGRGGQALLAVFSYMVFTKGLSRTMETSSVSHGTFKAVTLHHDTLTRMALLTKDFFRTGGRRAKAAIFWTILAGSFVLSVPTWLSAMTGYTADFESYIQDSDNTLVPTENLRHLLYTIHDGARLGNGFRNDTRIAVPWQPNSWEYYGDRAMYSCPLSAYIGYYDYSSFEAMYIEFDQRDTTTIECKWMWAVSNYVSEYGFLGNSTTVNTTFHRPDDSAITTRVNFNPPLNISAHFAMSSLYDYWEDTSFMWNQTPYGPISQDPDYNIISFNVFSADFWHPTIQKVYNFTELNSAGTCQQQGLLNYRWGFSFLILYAFVATFLIWTIGMWAFYLDSWLHSRLDVSHRRMGLERAVLDLSQSMQSTVDADHVELHGDSQLRTLVETNQLTYSGLPLDLDVDTRWSQSRRWWRDFRVKPWAKDEKWWLCALLCFVLISALTWFQPLHYGGSPIWALSPELGVLLVIIVGRRVSSRWVLFAVCFLLFWALNSWWIHHSIVSTYDDWWFYYIYDG